MAMASREPHERRVLRQAIKKAKNFEIRKLCRKLRQAEVDGAKPGGRVSSSSQDTGKLSSQLEALKALDVQAALGKVCSDIGLEENSEDGTSGSKLIENNAKLTTWAVQRVLATTTVRSIVQQIALAKAEAAKNLADAGNSEGEDGVLTSNVGEPPSEAKAERRNRVVALEHGLNNRDHGKSRKRKLESNDPEGGLKKQNQQSFETGGLDDEVEDLQIPIRSNDVQKRVKGDVKLKKISEKHAASKKTQVEAQKAECSVPHEIAAGGDDFFIDDSPAASFSASDMESEGSDMDSEEGELPMKGTSGRIRQPLHSKKGTPKKKKNRAGQRLRQRLAEMKYGTKARHVVKDTSRQSRSPATDASSWNKKKLPGKQPAGARERFSERASHYNRKGGEGKGRNSSRHEGREQRGGGREVKEGNQGVGQWAKPKEDLAQLHPSWAAKAAQAKKLTMAGTGKKIKFDD